MNTVTNDDLIFEAGLCLWEYITDLRAQNRTPENLTYLFDNEGTVAVRLEYCRDQWSRWIVDALEQLNHPEHNDFYGAYDWDIIPGIFDAFCEQIVFLDNACYADMLAAAIAYFADEDEKESARIAQQDPTELAQDSEKEDMVNHPKHYKVLPNLESIEIIKAALTPEEFQGFCKGNFIKYKLRAGQKDDLEQDIKKAEWYQREAFASAV